MPAVLPAGAGLLRPSKRPAVGPAASASRKPSAPHAPLAASLSHRSVPGWGRPGGLVGSPGRAGSAVGALETAQAAEAPARAAAPPPGQILVLLDRDGVINVDRGTWVMDPDDLELEEGSAEAISQLNAAEHKVVIVTNQSCVGRGLITSDDLEAIHSRLRDLLDASGAHIDGILYAPDAPPEGENVGAPASSFVWRKPGPGMMLAAMELHNISKDRTVLIGDTVSDMLAAHRAGIKKVMVCTGHGAKVRSLLEAEGRELPTRILPSDGEFGGLPPEILPLTVHGNLASAARSILSGGLIRGAP